MKNLILFGLMAAGLLIAFIHPFNGLDVDGHIMFGAFVAALGAWMFRPGGGAFFTGTIIIFLGGTFSGLPFLDVANGFASPAFWLLVPAMFFGYALLKTGLGKRLVFGLFKHTDLSYGKIMAGWFVVGVIFSLFTPSITVRISLLAPIAVVVADACQLDKQSRGRSLVILTAWAVAILPGIAWQNGSLYGIVFTTFLPEGLIRDMATADMWFRVMAPWIPMSIIYLAALYFTIRPDESLRITKEQLSQMYADLGPFSSEEKKCSVAFAFLVIFLALANFLPITTNQVMFGAFIIILMTGVINLKDVSQGVNWDVIAFFGVFLGFSHLAEVSGISAWLSPILAGLMQPIAHSHIIFVLALYGICVLIRFLDAAQGYVSSAIMALATPMLFEDFGIHPLVPMMVFICAANLFLFRYHQPWIGQVEALAGEKGWRSYDLTKSAILYLVLTAVFLVICVFYWRAVGILF